MRILSPRGVECEKGVKRGVFHAEIKEEIKSDIKEGVVARRHLLKIKREQKFPTVQRGRVERSETETAGITRPNSMSFAHPRFVDPLDSDVVGERWLLPEY